MCNKKILLNYFLYFFCFILLCFYGCSHALAYETKTIYRYWSDGSLHDSGIYGYGYLNSGGVQSSSQASVGTTVSGVSHAFWFYYYDTIALNRTYSLKINFMSNDLIKDVDLSYFDISSCQDGTCNPSSLVSIQKQNTNSNSQWVIIKFNPTSVGNFVRVRINGNNFQPLTSVTTFGISNIQTEFVNANQDIINNQTNNTNNIIDNNNNNTQDIINNQNDNTQAIIDSNKENFQTCRNSYNILNFSDFLSTRGAIFTYSNGVYSITNLGSTYSNPYTLTLEPNTTYTISQKYQSQSSTNLRVDILKNGSGLVSCYATNENIIKQTFTTDSSSTYTLRINYSNFSSPAKFNSIMLQKGSFATSFEPYGEEICTNKIDETTNAVNGLNDTLNDDDSTGATSEASDFFESFTTNTFGLTSIITAPLSLIQSITSSTCNDLELPLPYLNNKKLILPCMTTIYSTYFGTFFTLYQTITYGIIAYWVCVRIFNQVKDFKNPEHDEIEVVDL